MLLAMMMLKQLLLQGGASRPALQLTSASLQWVGRSSVACAHVQEPPPCHSTALHYTGEGGMYMPAGRPKPSPLHRITTTQAELN